MNRKHADNFLDEMKAGLRSVTSAEDKQILVLVALTIVLSDIAVSLHPKEDDLAHNSNYVLRSDIGPMVGHKYRCDTCNEIYSK